MHSKGYVESLEDVPSVADMANQDTGSGADKWTGDSFTASALKGASFQTISILVFTSTGIGTKKLNCRARLGSVSGIRTLIGVLGNF